MYCLWPDVVRRHREEVAALQAKETSHDIAATDFWKTARTETERWTVEYDSRCTGVGLEGGGAPIMRKYA